MRNVQNLKIRINLNWAAVLHTILNMFLTGNIVTVDSCCSLRCRLRQWRGHRLHRLYC